MPDPSDLAPGDVIRTPELGPVKADDGSTLVLLFLGTCRDGLEPDVPAYLASVGFRRAHSFELESRWQSDGEVVTEVDYFAAASPAEAVEAAVRLVQARTKPGTREPLRIELALHRPGTVSSAGHLEPSRGRVFAAWSVLSGRPLEDLLGP